MNRQRTLEADLSQQHLTDSTRDLPKGPRMHSFEDGQQMKPFSKRLRRIFPSGWRTGALLSCITATTVLLVNASAVIWIIARYGVKNGTAALYVGACQKVASMNNALQLAINILCTVLLGASNFCMQCLTSPTRAEIDAAHARRCLLRIGVPSVRNLRGTSWGRFLLWIALGLSAFPLHFLLVLPIIPPCIKLNKILATMPLFSPPFKPTHTRRFLDLRNFSTVLSRTGSSMKLKIYPGLDQSKSSEVVLTMSTYRTNLNRRPVPRHIRSSMSLNMEMCCWWKNPEGYPLLHQTSKILPPD